MDSVFEKKAEKVVFILGNFQIMSNNLPVSLPPLPPRAQACWNNIQMGFKMGAAVGGTFGLLAGGYSAIANRSFWLFPLGIIGGAASFGFFLGCGMIIRCEEGPLYKRRACP